MSCTPNLRPNPPALLAAAPELTSTPYQGDVFERLLRERVIFLGNEVTDELANDVNAKLLLLDADGHDRDISLYINSPGGSVYAGMAIFDTMQMVRSDVATICIGLAASMGQFLLCAGAKGKRSSLPHSRILMHQPLGQMQGKASDIQIHAEQMAKTKKQMASIISQLTGQPVERVEEDSDRDRWFTPEQALDYGMIDHIVTTTRPAAANGQVG